MPGVAAAGVAAVGAEAAGGGGAVGVCAGASVARGVDRPARWPDAALSASRELDVGSVPMSGASGRTGRTARAATVARPVCTAGFCGCNRGPTGFSRSVEVAGRAVTAPGGPAGSSGPVATVDVAAVGLPAPSDAAGSARVRSGTDVMP